MLFPFGEIFELAAFAVDIAGLRGQVSSQHCADEHYYYKSGKKLEGLDNGLIEEVSLGTSSYDIRVIPIRVWLRTLITTTWPSTEPSLPLAAAIP